jgi:uncharacterized protein (TIGR02266 family)
MAIDPALLPVFLEYRRLDRKRRFSKLTESEAKRYGQLRRDFRDLFFHGSTGEAGDDRREGVRVPLNMELAFADRNAFRKAWSKDISGGGLMVETDAELEVGQKVVVHLHIGNDQHIDASSDVVWCRHNPSGSRYQRTVGFRFSGLDEPTSERIHDMVYRRMEEEAARTTFLDEAAIERLISGTGGREDGGGKGGAGGPKGGAGNGGGSSSR